LLSIFALSNKKREKEKGTQIKKGGGEEEEERGRVREECLDCGESKVPTFLDL
jgi:hypothetical protein